jgi:hypothetical protein
MSFSGKHAFVTGGGSDPMTGQAISVSGGETW